MTSLITSASCCATREIERITLTNTNAEFAGGTFSAGQYELFDIENVISVVPHQVTVPIIGLANSVRLKLRNGSTSLDRFDDGVRRYALSVQLKRSYIGDEVANYLYPSDMIPIWRASEPSRLGSLWQFAWELQDGTPYGLTAPDEWSVELFVIKKCPECLIE